MRETTHLINPIAYPMHTYLDIVQMMNLRDSHIALVAPHGKPVRFDSGPIPVRLLEVRDRISTLIQMPRPVSLKHPLHVPIDQHHSALCVVSLQRDLHHVLIDPVFDVAH